ncbi:MAG: putative RNA uridine N3 methyltransferase [Methanocellales archaeon]
MPLGAKLTLLIPSSLTMEKEDLKIKTYKIGTIARAAAIYRVDKIIIYQDREFDDSKFISTILRYAETPQYLRKYLFPRSEILRYAGVIPPLRTQHHPLGSESSSIGDIREGIIRDVGSDGSAWVEIGLECPALLRNSGKARKGERLTIKIFSREPLEVKVARQDEIPPNWGYRVEIGSSLGKILSKSEDLVIATSKKGEAVNLKLLSKIAQEIKNRSISIAFGSPTRGLTEILRDEGIELSNVSDYILNTIPNQGAQTVRSEEAIHSTLALLNALR